MAISDKAMFLESGLGATERRLNGGSDFFCASIMCWIRRLKDSSFSLLRNRQIQVRQNRGNSPVPLVIGRVALRRRASQRQRHRVVAWRREVSAI